MIILLLRKKKKESLAWQKICWIYANIQSENSNGFSHCFVDYKNKREKLEKDLRWKRKVSLNFRWRVAKLIQSARCTHMGERIGGFIFGGHNSPSRFSSVTCFGKLLFNNRSISENLRCVDSDHMWSAWFRYFTPIRCCFEHILVLNMISSIFQSQFKEPKELEKIARGKRLLSCQHQIYYWWQLRVVLISYLLTFYSLWWPAIYQESFYGRSKT